LYITTLFTYQDLINLKSFAETLLKVEDNFLHFPSGHAPDVKLFLHPTWFDMASNWAQPNTFGTTAIFSQSYTWCQSFLGEIGLF